jgi:hypothetical protein
VGGGVWAATGNPWAVPVSFATGVLIDGDHVVDYADWLMRGWRKYIFVPLHAWEFAAIGLVAVALWYHPLFLAAVLGQLSHVITDHFTNHLKPWGYSITYRAANKFLGARLMRPRGIELSHEKKPLWAYIEPTVWRMIVRRRRRKPAEQDQRAKEVGD